ncbi:MAG: glycosyltransferase family 4 protein [Vicinamibacterales bacterium]
MPCIGIDATAIPPNRVGAGNYIFNLVRAISSVETGDKFIVFAKPEHIAEWAIDRPNFRFVPAGSRVRGVRMAWEQSLLPLLVRRLGIDVLHSPHYTSPLLKPASSVVTFCDMIFVLFPHVHTRVKRTFFPRIMRHSARTADVIVTISKSTADDLTRLWPEVAGPAKVRAIPLAAAPWLRPVADVDEIDAVCSQHGVARNAYILYVGVLEPRKNLVTLLHAYRSLLDRGAAEKLVMAGRPGWGYGDVYAAARSLGLSDMVVFTGYVPDRSLPALYSGAAVFAYPSLYEGFGLPVLEAMSCGTPVVTSNVSSMAEIAGDAARLADPRSADSLASALQDVLSDRDLRGRLRERGLARAREFSWERTARETCEVYREAARASHG